MRSRLNAVVIGAIALLAVLGLPSLGAVGPAGAQQPTSPSQGAKKVKESAVITMEKGGEIKFDFFPEDAPKTVENFVTLARKGFYDGLTFHRVEPGFVVQGGDPQGNGMGGPGYKIKAEFNKKPHDKGVLSMARSQDPNSAGSQFFICHGDPKFLDNQYTAFGKLIKGDDVLEKIATTQTTTPDRPVKRMNVESVKIVPRSEVK